MHHLKAFHVFHMVVSSSTLTEAANRLCITHGAVSKQIKTLEGYLGQPLFYKQGRQLHLTDQGRRLKGYTQQAFDALEEGIAELTATRETVLTVSCEPTLAMRWLMPRLSQFQMRYPDIDVRLSTAGGPVDLNAQGIDLAIRRDDFTITEPCVVNALCDEYIGPVLSPSYWQSIQNSERQMVYLHSQTRHQAWQDWFAQNAQHAQCLVALSRAVQHSYEHFYFCLQAATDGLGAAIGSYPLVIDDVEQGRLIAPFGFTRSGCNYMALTQQQPAPQASVFYEWLQSLMT